jgi:hypothetical protein
MGKGLLAGLASRLAESNQSVLVTSIGLCLFPVNFMGILTRKLDANVALSSLWLDWPIFLDCHVCYHIFPIFIDISNRLILPQPMICLGY